MNQNLLNIFVALYECGSMHKAAEYLYISQQGISKSILSLEEEFDVKLFERSNAGVKPTLAGDILYQDALKFRDQYSSLCRKMKDAKSGKQVLSLACAYGTMYRLYPVLKDFERHNPKCSVRWQELTDTEVEKKILQEQADLAVNVSGLQREYVKFVPLYSCKVCLLVYEGHPLYHAETIRFQDLQGERIVIEGEQFRIYSLFRTLCERANVYPEIIAETAEIGFCQHMAEMQEGLAVTIDFIAQERKLSGVRAIPFEEPEFFWQIGLEFLDGRKKSDEVEQLIRFIQKSFS
ncbi:MAG: LysR family transcriptional regulator [Lachnospiraceae bacterium]|nr:LysR family transcriptional regulator [Lachnospiraceae bacterium]